MKFLQDLTEQERKTLTVWGIIGIVVFLFAVIFKVAIIDKDKNSNPKAVLDKTYSVVQDYDRYYTVVGALERYYGYINAGDELSLVKVLNQDYVKDKKITEENVLDYLVNSDVEVSFEPGLMCKKTVAVGKTNYLFKVKEVPVFLQEGDEFTDTTDASLTYAYYQILLDGNTLHFSVKPISKDSFGDECHG